MKIHITLRTNTDNGMGTYFTVQNLQCNSLFILSFRALLVSFLVDCKKSLAYKIMVTYITLVRPLSCVEALVNGQCGELSKRLLAQLTLIWTFTCVRALMLLQALFPDESLPTHIAGVRPIPSMYLAMEFEAISGTE
jgi:hypothetical protein